MLDQEEIIPFELFKVLDSIEFENDGYISITGLDYFEDDLNVQLSIFPGEELPKQLWELEIAGLKKEHLNISQCNNINFSKEHTLLYQFTASKASLYFNGKAPDAANLLADIYQCHRSMLGYWIDVEEYLNTNFEGSSSLNKLCQTSFGLFATGPRIYLEEYFKVLNKHQMHPHFYPANNTPLLNTVKSLGILIIGDSYFIGEGFNLVRG